MTKVFNPKLANTEVVFSFGKVQFDEDGIADIQPDETAQVVLAVDGFKAVDEELTKRLEESKSPQGTTENPAPTPVVTENEDGTQQPVVPPGIVDAVDKAHETAEKANDGMTHKQLDALAEKLGTENYPKDGNKEEKIEAINK